MCDRPEIISLDERGRRHCETGPAIKWRDGYSMYYWHGVRVPARLIERPESYTAAEIRKIRNSEIARALAERMGWDKFTGALGATVIDDCDIEAHGEDGQRCTLHYELLELNDQFSDRQPRFLRMQSPVLRDGTQPRYIDPVDPGLETARAARAWRTQRRDGSWPTVAECNRGLVPDWDVRHGDVVFHRVKPQDVKKLKILPGNSLVSGSATGHSHSLVGVANVYQLGDGTRLVERVSESLAIDHEEHKLTQLPGAWYRQSIARQYDAEHGWVNVED
ncbi:MAG: DUF6745 domain-containing protein [Bryobacteraceae bacterium]